MKNKTAYISDTNDFISRELSWIDFNSRVLDEADLEANKLLEKLKFISIASGNLDEFFMVRIAGLRQLVRAGENRPDPAGNRPERQLALARAKIMRLVHRQYRLLTQNILPELETHGVFLRKFEELSQDHIRNLKRYFRMEILPVLTPLAVDPAHPFPQLNSGAINIALELKCKNKKYPVHAFVEVPEVLPRFIPLTTTGDHYTDERGEHQQKTGDQQIELILLEDLISANIEELFPGCVILEKATFRITRDMDFSVEDDLMDNLLETVRGKILQRRQRVPVRLEVSQKNSHSKLVKYLLHVLNLNSDFCYILPGPLHLKQFFALVSAAERPELLEEPWKPVIPPVFQHYNTVFDAIRANGTLLLALPYQSFSPVVKFIEQAADDPDVLAIKQTLYRVSGNSPIVHALQRAAENGKQVTVVLELKARFDESNNIAWAELLDRSGAHVVYGIAGLKVHSKALMVVRREAGHIRRYVHLGTGNYNDKTAALYTDMGIFSCDPELCFDVANMFNLLSGCSAPPENWNHLVIAPFDLRHKFEELIEREIRHGKNGRIIAKMNSLADEKMVLLLHRAADAGVEIDLIIRGICCYRPRAKQENIRIYSIVDRFLEHSRIYYFGNMGNPEYFLASADWMTRNLDRRIEAMFPVYDEKLREQIDKLLQFQLEDSDKKRKLLPSGAYMRPHIKSYSENRSQAKSFIFFKDSAADELRGANGEPLKVFTSHKKQQ